MIFTLLCGKVKLGFWVFWFFFSFLCIDSFQIVKFPEEAEPALAWLGDHWQWEQRHWDILDGRKEPDKSPIISFCSQVPSSAEGSSLELSLGNGTNPSFRSFWSRKLEIL